MSQPIRKPSSKHTSSRILRFEKAHRKRIIVTPKEEMTKPQPTAFAGNGDGITEAIAFIEEIFRSHLNTTLDAIGIEGGGFEICRMDSDKFSLNPQQQTFRLSWGHFCKIVQQWLDDFLLDHQTTPLDVVAVDTSSEGTVEVAIGFALPNNVDRWLTDNGNDTFLSIAIAAYPPATR